MKRIVGALLAVVGCASPAAAVPILYAGNGHYYEYIPTLSTWDEARAAADASSHLGLDGYLATITDLAEQNFILLNVTRSVAWLGGNDRAVEGVWRWVVGPEAGSIFYGPGAPVGAFAYWNGGEPNDCCGGEDDLVFGWDFSTGRWNDIGLPAFSTYEVGYIVEYSGAAAVPEPATLTLFGLGLIAVRRFARR